MNRKQIVNAFYNGMGNLIPMLATVLTLPIIVKALDSERFSALTLAWALLGYLLLFDLGLGRAATRLISVNLKTQNIEEMNHIFWSSTWMIWFLSLAVSLVSILFLPLLLAHLQFTSDVIRTEVGWSMLVLCLSLPFLTLTANLRGALEAHGRFFGINLLHGFTGLACAIGPLPFLRSPNPLLLTVSLIVALRTLNFIGHAWFALLRIPNFRKPLAPRKKDFAELWKFGGWVTVSNVVGPLLQSVDRFILGLFVPMSRVGFYTTPMEMATKLLVIPSSLSRVLFPDFTHFFHQPQASLALYRKAVLLVGALMAIPSLAIIAGAKPLLTWWLNPEFGNSAAICLQILTLGTWINALAWVPHTLLHSTNHTRRVAIIHLTEVAPYLLIMVLLIKIYGIEGAALAWLVRVLADAIALFWSAKTLVTQKARSMVQS